MENDQLFLLIKSLSKAEKRQFKLYANKHEGAKDYVELFNEIEHQKVYNEAKIKEKLKNRKLAKNFAVVKNYLFNTIIESLQELIVYDTAESKIDSLLKKINILYQKGIIDTCLRYIEKAKIIAENHEMFVELIKILNIQHQISLRNTSLLFKKRKEILEELDLVTDKLYNLSQYEKLGRQVSYYLLTENLPINSVEINAILQHPLMLRKESALSRKAMILYLRIHAEICSHEGKIKDSMQYNYEILRNLETANISAKEFPFIYARAINTYLQDALEAKHFDNFNYYLSILKDLFSQKISSHHLNTIKGFYYLNLIRKQIIFGNFKEILEILSSNREELSSKLIPIKFRIGIIYFECIACIGLNQYKEALKILHTFLLGNENIILPIKRISRLLSIIIHFELSNVTTLLSEIENTYRYILNLENNLAEKSILKYFKQLLNCSFETEKTELFNKLKNELLTFEGSPQIQPLLYFDFLSWIESKIKNKSFIEIVQEKGKEIITVK